MKRPVPAKVQIGRFVRRILPAAVIIVSGILGIFGVLVYRITHPGAVPEAVNPSHYLLPSLDVVWPAGDGSEISGWWIPGLKGAPGILLAPGYGMGRSDALSLAVQLHGEGFNLLVYDSRGSGAAPRGASSLGLHETDDMLSALRYMKGRPELNVKVLVIWGVDVEARAALQAASRDPDVRSIAVDAPYDTIMDYLDVRVREDMGFENGLLEFGCRQMFRIVHFGSAPLLNERLATKSLSDRAILFIRGENQADVSKLTEPLYFRIQPQKEMVTLRTGRVHMMSGDGLTNYDRQVATFFHLNLKE